MFSGIESERNNPSLKQTVGFATVFSAVNGRILRSQQPPAAQLFVIRTRVMPEPVRLMTVGDLRRFLREIPDDVSIGIAIPPATPASAEMSVVFAARAVYTGGPVLRFTPAEGESVSVVVTDTLSITGRGVAVLLDVYGGWQFGEKVRVRIEQSNGETLEVPGEVEFALLAEPRKHERPAVLLRGMDAVDVPVGTKLLIKGAG